MGEAKRRAEQGLPARPKPAKAAPKDTSPRITPWLPLTQRQGERFVELTTRGAWIGIGALVPAAIMSIATANLFTRNIYKEYIKPDCSTKEEAQMAKVVSLVVKVGALAFVIFLPLQYAIQLQLLGGVWMSQTLPAVLISLYTRWFHRTALLIGWIAGIGIGTWMVSTLGFKSTVYPLSLDGLTIPGYATLYALATNLAVSVVLTWVFNALGIARGDDVTEAHHYHA